MSMDRLLDSEFCLRLTLTLLHFIWQGVAIALAAMAACVLLRRAGSAARYWVLVASLAAMALCPVATFLWLPSGIESQRALKRSDSPEWSMPADLNTANVDRNDPIPADLFSATTPLPAPVATLVAHPLRAGLSALTIPGSCRRIAPGVAVGYFSGILAMLARLLLALGGGRGLRSQSQPVTETAYLASLERAAKAVGLRAMPAVAWCRRVAVPTVVGILKPTILLPISLSSGLSTEQVEMLLLHELAHLRRHDHWVNLAQWVIETALFFHPAVWLVSQRIRVERELACDDLVLAAGVEKASYAESLLRMAELSRCAVAPEPLSALALGSHGPRRSGFGRRVLRLIEGRDGLESLRPARLWPLGVAVVMLLVVGASVAFRSAGHLPADESIIGYEPESRDMVKKYFDGNIISADANSIRYGKDDDSMLLDGFAKVIMRDGEKIIEITSNRITIQMPLGSHDNLFTLWGQPTIRTLDSTEENEVYERHPEENILDEARTSTSSSHNDFLTSDIIFSKVTTSNLDLRRSQAADQILAELTPSDKTYRIDLSGSSITDDGLANLSKFKSLAYLSLENTRISDQGLENISALTKLSQLYLYKSQVTDKGLAILTRMPRLEQLNLGGNGITNAGLRNIASLRLTSLSLWQTQVTDEGVTYIKDMPLVKLNFGHEKITNRSLETISQMKNLSSLDLFHTDIDDQGMPLIGMMTNLKSIGLAGTEITDNGLAHLKNLQKLEWLDLHNNTAISNAGIEHLIHLSALKKLDVSETRVTDACLDTLKSMRSLKEVEIRHTSISDAGVAELKAALDTIDDMEVQDIHNEKINNNQNSLFLGEAVDRLIVAVESVQVVPVKDKTWALVVRADNPTSATQYLGVDIYANLNRFLGGATHRAEIFTLVPGFSGDLRREFQLVHEPFGLSRPNDVHIQVGRTRDDQYYLQDDIRFLPPDAEMVLDTSITLPTKDAKERILFKSQSNEAFDYPTFPNKRKADTRVVRGHVTEDGLPAPGKRVLIVEEYDSVLHETVSDAEGTFVFNLTSPNSLGQCVYWAEGGDGRVSPLGISNKSSQSIENLSLGAPVVLEGNVFDAINQPLGGVTVTASPALSSGYRKTVTTDALGAYRIELPPYPNGYQLSASLAGYFQPYKPFNDKAITAKAGEISRQNLTLPLSARLEGKVIGPQGQPASDALITWQAYPTPLDVRETTTTTGQQGQFTLTTGHVGEWLELRVSSKRWGNAKQSIEVPLEGETLADIVIQTPGSVNLKGRVLDPSGQPVRNMKVSAGHYIQNPYTQTDADGRFAFTGVSLPQKGNTIQIGVIPPRPEFIHHQRDWKTGEIPPRVEAILRRPIDRQRTWYQQKFIDREGQPGETLDVTIHLEPAQVITFSGTVRDQNGQPVPNAELTLFAGTPDPETWMAQMYPFERSLMTGGGPWIVVGPMHSILTSCLADEEGRYTLSAIRENVNPSVWHNPPRNAGVPNPEEFSIGAGKGYQNAKLITGLSLPLDEDQRQVDIDLLR